jgi:hypothetical protein
LTSHSLPVIINLLKMSLLKKVVSFSLAFYDIDRFTNHILASGGVSEWPMVTVLKTVEKLSPKLNWFFHIFHFVRKFPLCPTMFATN